MKKHTTFGKLAGLLLLFAVLTATHALSQTKKTAKLPVAARKVVGRSGVTPSASTASTKGGTEIDLTVNYNGAFACPDNTAWDTNKDFTLTLVADKGTSVDDFFNKTTLVLTPKGQSPRPEITLAQLMKDNIGQATIDSLKKFPFFNVYPLAKKLHLDMDSLFAIKLYLGSTGTKTCTFTVNAGGADKGNKEDGSQKMKSGDNLFFIPSPADEANWLQKPILTEPPILNDHTRWMLEYDMHRQDPVAIWKRTTDKRTPATYVKGTGDTSPATYEVVSNRSFRPTANRDILISVRNFHPYRDSLSLAVDYIDRNIDHADLFTSTFTNAFHLGTSTPVTANTDSTVNGKSGKLPDSMTMTEKFAKLKDELKIYYEQKYNQPIVDINVITNGIFFIKQNMTKQLGITDFSESGITRLAESKADKNGDLDKYFATVREAIKYYILVTRFNYFDNKSVLVQNKDAIQLTLNRYTDGKLVTSPNEALRVYNISGGFKVDFSLGLYGSFLKDRMHSSVPVTIHDTVYATNPNGTLADPKTITSIAANQRQRIIKDERGSFNIGPAVFTHLYWKTGRELNAGFTAGISIDQQANPRYLLGGSLLFGLERRWVFSYGAAFGMVKSLASGLEEGDVIDLSGYPNSTIPTKDVMNVKGFVAISFNFSGFNVGGSSSKAKK